MLATGSAPGPLPAPEIYTPTPPNRVTKGKVKVKQEVNQEPEVKQEVEEEFQEPSPAASPSRRASGEHPPDEHPGAEEPP